MQRKLKNGLQKGSSEVDRKAIEYPQGLKWTRQRKIIYRILRAATEPLNAIQIYTLAMENMEGEECAVSTVYRILSAFEEQGFVEKSVGMGDGTVVYSLDRGMHTHYAVCLECHRRIPLQNCPFIRMHPNLSVEDFTVTGHKLELYGYCRECRESRDKEGDKKAEEKAEKN